MIDKRSLVLVAGIGKGPFESLAPVLDRQRLEVVKVERPEMSVDLARAKSFDLLIFDAVVREGTLGQVVENLRHETSASRQASLLVLATQGNVDLAYGLIDRGVNRVMLLEDPPELIGLQVAELLHIAPRANLRFSTHLRTAVSGDGVEVLGEAANLSASGMLIETKTPFEPGERVTITLNLGGTHGSATAEALVVRQAVAERGGVDGIGVQFLNFAGDSRKKIDAVLDQALTDPEIN
ncbi:MAG: PilZ domain-containing protein [Acidobacteria bacterium]|nr:PilZ domain-containing protein [Acidobacteriota bacterium]